MLTLRLLPFSLVAVLLVAGPVVADKPHLAPDQLQRATDLIVVGVVQSYRTEVRTSEGEERTHVLLDVLVEAVEKGERKELVGQVLQVHCERLTRRSLVGLATHIGNEAIPAPKSRARFFLKGESALSPNGIELLDGASELDLPMRSSWSALLEWPLVSAPVGLIALLALVGFLACRKRRSARPA